MAPVTPVDLVRSRLPSEEGTRPLAYNDATGKTVTCKPAGNLTIGRGINLEVGLDATEMEFLERNRLGKVALSLYKFDWYRACNAVRQSVLLDIAWNSGVEGLMHFPHMLAAIARGDWTTAKAECRAQDPRLQGRYTALGDMLFRGEL